MLKIRARKNATQHEGSQRNQKCRNVNAREPRHPGLTRLHENQPSLQGSALSHCGRDPVLDIIAGFLVPGVGLEPTHLAAADFESAASTDSAIPAQKRRIIYETSQRINSWPGLSTISITRYRKN